MARVFVPMICLNFVLADANALFAVRYLLD
jgi:hypothetical protein